MGPLNCTMPQKHNPSARISVDDALLPPAGTDEIYFEALEGGSCMLPACKRCGRWNWPVRFRCGDCGTWENEWKRVDLKGAIYSWTRTWHTFDGLEEIRMPFVSLVVDLDCAP